MKTVKLPSQKRLLEVFTYDSQTGELRWRDRVGKGGGRRIQKRFVGKLAGKRSGRYLLVRVDAVQFKAARVIWKIVTGKDPRDQIDHINCNRHDNRAKNLRDATNAQNTSNRKRLCSKSLPKGVDFHNGTQKFRARISKNGILYQLGLFKSVASAHAAYRAASKRMHGEFGRFD